MIPCLRECDSVGTPELPARLLGGEYTVGGLFGTMARAFRLESAAAPRCSNAVQPEAAGDSIKHERHLTSRPFCLDATHGLLWHRERVIA
jgi:hypothetical protein